MRITYAQMEAIREALGTYNNTNDNPRVVYSAWLSREESPIEFSVNWSAMGDKTPEETVTYAKKMIRSSQIAEDLTAMEIIVDYSTMKREYTATEIEMFKATVEGLTHCLNGNAGVKYWVELAINYMKF